MQMKNCDPVRVRSGVRHGENPRSLVLEREVFIRKRSSVDASSAVLIGGEIAALTHEGRNRVKPRSDVSLPLGFFSHNCLKFSAVLGATSARSSMTTRPSAVALAPRPSRTSAPWACPVRERARRTPRQSNDARETYVRERRVEGITPSSERSSSS